MKILEAVAVFENSFNWTSSPTRTRQVHRTWFSSGQIGEITLRLCYVRGLARERTWDAIISLLIITPSSGKSKRLSRTHKIEAVTPENAGIYKLAQESIVKIEIIIGEAKRYIEKATKGRSARTPSKVIE